MEDLTFLGYLLNAGVPTQKIIKAAEQHQIEFRYILDNSTSCLVYACKANEPYGAFEYSFQPNRLQLHALAEGKSLFVRDGFAPADPY